MRRHDILALAVVIALFLGLCAAIGPFHPDRSFVAYRYAENLAAGNGLAFNPGDAPSEGYASTLWVAQCAMLRVVGLSLPVAAPLLSLFFGVLALAMLWVVVRARVSLGAAVVATGFAAASGPLAIAAMSGEGTTMAAALVVILVALLGRAGARPVWWVPAGIIGVLLATCGNALVLVFPVALVIRIRMARGHSMARGGALLAAAVFIAGVAAFHAWRMTTFGSLDALEAGFGDRPHDMAPFGSFYLMLAVAGLAGARASRDQLSAWIACGTAAVWALVTLGVSDPLPGLAGSCAMVLLLAIPIAGLVDAIPRGNRSRMIEGLVVVSLLMVCIGWTMDLRVFARNLRSAHDATLAPLGIWMAQWRSNGSLLCDTPGAVPYYSGWRTVMVGGHAALAGAPDVVMLTSNGLFTPEMGAEQAGIAAGLAGRYRVMAAVRRDWTRDRAFIVYTRDDIPRLSDELAASFPQGIGSVARMNR